jgi:ABC-type uncharacterized transport system permease subunit
MSVRSGPVALALSLIYMVFGLGVFLIFEFSERTDLTLPLGFVAPIVDFSFKLHLPRTPSWGLNLLYLAGALVSYTFTGAITGSLSTLCFNFAAQRIGGIPAKLVVIEQDEPVPLH